MSARNVIQYVPAKLISYFENTNIPFSFYWVTFFSITVLRQFIESYSQKWNYFNSISPAFFGFYLHGMLCYLTIAMLITVIAYFITGISVAKILRVILPSFILLIITPLLDLVFTRGAGANIFYLLPDIKTDLLYTYLTVGGGYIGVTPGMRIEVLMVILGCYLYFRAKKLNVIPSLLSAWTVYTSIFLIGVSPYFIKWFLGLLGMKFILTNELMIHFYLILMLILVPLLFYLNDKKTFESVTGAINQQWLVHHELMLILGVILGFSNVVDVASGIAPAYQNSMINIILCMTGIVYLHAALAAKRIAMQSASKKNNAEAPGRIGVLASKYNLIANICILLAILYPLFSDVKSAFLISLTAASMYVYSMPPLRLKRAVIISKLLVSLDALAFVMMGYLLIQYVERGFQNIVIWIFLLGYTVAANLLDFEGSDLQGMHTVVNMIGARAAKCMIGAAFWLTYLAFYFVLPNIWLGVMLGFAGAVQFYLINRRNFNPGIALSFCNLTFILIMSFILYHAGGNSIDLS
jgi:hypothetical protein